ncbi:2-polyprenyl-6-methoxyphenol hydroxylase [Chitinophaga sp. YR627]|uniref:FAD-dependent oxidoreductase n=1 Tax=Chitinophaga sp. YR627 TaxID=1881041 RepID=UPI0008DFFB23|nr:FAD-dependent oxidoreductase [Chitinophaga sp. YR627]SFM88042.1 2-polyprenyl-6-methoxyphenol hydroxylase [Chitinophaga sp. YR627]
MDHTNTTQVVIVGGGITGLAAALFLAQQGVDFILLEKHKGTSIYPRARTIDIRTMELFRGLGLSEALREGGKALAPAWGVLRGDNLMNTLQSPTVITDKMTPAQLVKAQNEMKVLTSKSPESLCRCTQDISEAIMREQLSKQDLRFHHQLLSFEQDHNGVKILVEDRTAGKAYTVLADYMIAADGANSMVRTQLNIPTSGNTPGTDLLNIYFEADLAAIVAGREFSQYLIDNADLTGFLLTINNTDRWAFHLRYYPEKGETAEDYPKEKLIPMLQRILGMPDLKISILAILPWQLTVRIADHMHVNRVFIAGDAAHTMTPYAGKGANTGIQDVQNLAWKLAAVLKHMAGEALLDTYNTERQPIGAYYATLSGELAGENGLINDALMITKGKDLFGLPNYGYLSPAVIRASDIPFTYFIGEPGTRVPHLWLNESHSLSSLDWIKGQFTLIANNTDSWQAECDHIKLRLGVPVQLIILDNKDILEKWKDVTATRDNEALLIRPDDFVGAKVSPGRLSDLMRSILCM